MPAHFLKARRNFREPCAGIISSDFSGDHGFNSARSGSGSRETAARHPFRWEAFMRKSTTIALALGFSAMLAGTAGAQIKMGVGGPFTGPNASFGAQIKNGADQAIEDINAKGGIQGQKITATYGDDVSDPKQGVSVANKFAADGVKFVIGHFNSGVTIPASEVYQENGILDITPAATNPKLTERNMWNVFRTCGRDDQQGSVAAGYLLKAFKGKKVAIVHDKTTYGQGLADETKKAINKGGLKEVLYEGVNAG